jgi:hypothetical protein
MPVTLIARVTDNVALADVAVWWGEDGLIANRTPAAPVGRDSFAVTIGAGIPAGHTLDYYFEAHDASGNTGRSESLVQGNHPWSITIGGDWAFDFENGPEGVIHVPYWYSYRDAWHLTTEDSSPSGGTSWKCGDDFPKPYPVHLDATLVLPVIASVEPGTRLRFDHRYALEQLDAGHAWDGARIEAQSGPGPWAVVVPTAGYDHVFISNSNPFEAGTPCWSGVSGWRTETVDLTPWAPGPVRLRFRMLADDFTGFDGWFVDRVRVEYPSSSGAVSPIATLEIGAAWPNPSGGRVRQSFSLERSAEVEWTLHDLAGRRVATLARGIFPAGARDLAAALPAGLPDGLYFLSLRIGDQPARSQRLALIR